MNYVFGLVMLIFGYHCFTYGISLWKNDKNKLGAVGTIMVATIGTIVPIVALFVKS